MRHSIEQEHQHETPIIMERMIWLDKPVQNIYDGREALLVGQLSAMLATQRRGSGQGGD